MALHVEPEYDLDKAFNFPWCDEGEQASPVAWSCRKDNPPVRSNARARARMMARRRVTAFYASALAVIAVGVATAHLLPFTPHY